MKPFKKGHDINKQDEDLKKRKLFVKGLPNSCSNSKLRSAFAKFGPVDKAFILFDHNTGLSRGFGFVEFLNHESVGLALAAAVIIDDRTVKCSPVILKQESKLLPAVEGLKPKSGTEGDRSEFPAHSLCKDSRHKKSQVFKTLNLVEDGSPEGEATKDSSGNNSFDKNSPGSHFGSPLIYAAFDGQHLNSLPKPSHNNSHQFQIANRSCSSYHSSLAPQFTGHNLASCFDADADLLGFSGKTSLPSAGFGLDKILISDQKTSTPQGYSVPLQPKFKKISYYKMF